MLTRYRGMGDVFTSQGAGTVAYDEWAASVKAALQDLYGDTWQQHGHVATIPDNVPPLMQQYVGQAAAVFDNVTYVELANSGRIDMSRPQVASNNGQVVFVLAPVGAIASQPPTMTLGQRAANAIFTAGDIAADAVGLPSLNKIEDTLKDIGKEIVIGAAVAVGVGLLLKHLSSSRR